VLGQRPERATAPAARATTTTATTATTTTIATKKQRHKRAKLAAAAAAATTEAKTMSKWKKQQKQQAVILFAHGAGAGQSSDWMQAWTQRLRSLPCVARVRPFEYSYMQQRRRGPPDRLPRLIECHVAAAQQLLRDVVDDDDVALFLVGKSMGSRVGCHVSCYDATAAAAAAKEKEEKQRKKKMKKKKTTTSNAIDGALLQALQARIRGVVTFGYPLVGSSAKRPVRDQVLLEMRHPVLFIAGTRDKMSPEPALRAVAKRMAPETAPRIHIVSGGDHSLRIRKMDGAQSDADDAMLAAVQRFISDHS
jgi:predicted alpha/beta-hydrolase family hydrolase